ncbi:MAG: MraY family glycosyltransferase [Thermosulfidibacteraceae bacterium]
MIFIKLNVFHDSHEGIQKFHKRPTPRIGGLALYTGLLATGITFLISGKSFAKEYLLLLLSAFPVFLAGILEDITKKVSPKWRLLAGFISGTIAFFLVSAQVRSVDIPFVDNLLSITAISLVFSAFAFAGVSHAFNIIDGFNGLLAGINILVFSAYAYVSFLHDDYFLLYINLCLVFVTLGFFFWNYRFNIFRRWWSLSSWFYGGSSWCYVNAKTSRCISMVSFTSCFISSMGDFIFYLQKEIFKR